MSPKTAKINQENQFNELDSKLKSKLSVFILSDIPKISIKSIKDLLSENLSNEAIQASLKIFFSTHKVIKIFWTLCILVSMGFCAYLVVQSILAYLTFGVITTTTNIVENPTDFPKITICK
jgi:hypothetical protein